jgi:aldehyde dehydrogenase (NAD+)
LQVVTGDSSTGAALVGAGVDKIMFTGSVATGKGRGNAAVSDAGGAGTRRQGSDGRSDDANIEMLPAALSGACKLQQCAAVERCYVHCGAVHQSSG